jgi:hypothetical protein
LHQEAPQTTFSFLKSLAGAQPSGESDVSLNNAIAMCDSVRLE